MRKTKENTPKVQQKALHLDSGMSLAEVIQKVMAEGVTDFSKVRYDHDYVGCNADHGDGYCYCPSSYADMRFEYSVEVK